MEKIKCKMAEIEAFLREKDISYKYVDYQLKRGDNYEIQIICLSTACLSLRLLEKEFGFLMVYPYTQSHILIEFEYND